MSMHTELIKEARSYADAEMTLHDESAVVGEKLEDTHASIASLFGALADALEAAESPTTVEWGVRHGETGNVVNWGIRNQLATADPRSYPGFTVVNRNVGPWKAVQS